MELAIRAPIGPLPPGRGFYQVEEDRLYVPVGPFDGGHRFFSYIDAQSVRFDLNKDGQLIFIEVLVARHNWPQAPRLPADPGGVAADIRWLDFREAMSEPELLTNHDRTQLLITLVDCPIATSYRLAEGVTLGLDAHSQPSRLWIDGIADDRAGLGIAAYRRMHRDGTASASD